MAAKQLHLLQPQAHPPLLPQAAPAPHLPQARALMPTEIQAASEQLHRRKSKSNAAEDQRLEQTNRPPIDRPRVVNMFSSLRVNLTKVRGELMRDRCPTPKDTQPFRHPTCPPQ